MSTLQLITTGPISNLLIIGCSMTCLFNACHHCNLEVCAYKVTLQSLTDEDSFRQELEFDKTIDALTTPTIHNNQVRLAKLSIMSQIRMSNVKITGKGLFVANRHFLMKVTQGDDQSSQVCQKYQIFFFSW